MNICKIIAVLVCFLVFSLDAMAKRRVALVIGNDKYETLPNLANAGKDARDMASKLSTLGFEVIALYNASERQIFRAMRKFSTRLSANDSTGLVYYAGHGIQANNTNYLIPSDAQVEEEADLEPEAIDIQVLLKSMSSAGADLNIVILDACRDNPLPNRSRSASRGLSITSVPRNAKGTAIIYAAGPGQTAADGAKGKNGVFTGALLRFIDKPGWSLEKVFRETSAEVLRRTHNKQRPWQLVSLQGEFRFNIAESVSKKAVVKQQPVKQDISTTIWQGIAASNQASDFRTFLKTYPNSPFAPFAKSRLTELEAKERGSKATAELEKRRQADEAAKLAALQETIKIRNTELAASRKREEELAKAAQNQKSKVSVNNQLSEKNKTVVAALPKKVDPNRPYDGIWRGTLHCGDGDFPNTLLEITNNRASFRFHSSSSGKIEATGEVNLEDGIFSKKGEIEVSGSGPFGRSQRVASYNFIAMHGHVLNLKGAFNWDGGFSMSCSARLNPVR